MLLTSLAALAALATALLLVVGVRRAVAVRNEAEEVRREVIRATEAREEADRLSAIRSDTVAGAVELGSAVARLGTETVAGVSFKLLDAARGVRRRSRRHRHALGDSVYGAISEASEELQLRAPQTLPPAFTPPAGPAPAVPIPPDAEEAVAATAPAAADESVAAPPLTTEVASQEAEHPVTPEDAAGDARSSG